MAHSDTWHSRPAHACSIRVWISRLLLAGRRLYVITCGSTRGLRYGGNLTLSNLSSNADLFWPEDSTDLDSRNGAGVPDVLPADGRFAGVFDTYVVIPETLLSAVVERTEAELAAFGSYAAMGPFGSFELRHSDILNSAGLNTWSGVTNFYYARERHLRPILEEMGIPIIPLKRDFLYAYERVITELGQL